MILDSFQEWKPKAYLKQYYSAKQITEDEIHVLKFIINFLKSGAYHFTEALDLGSGPTIHHIVPLAPHVENIYLADYLDSNLSEIKIWLDRDKKSHNWDYHVKGVLKLEGIKSTVNEVRKRSSLIREKVAGLLPCDIFNDDPLNMGRDFPLVTSFFCADSVTHSKEAWTLAMGNIFNLITPGGWFIMSALKEAMSYKVGTLEFPSAHINSRDVTNVLKSLGFKPDSITVEVVPTQVWKQDGFDGIIMAKAQKFN